MVGKLLVICCIFSFIYLNLKGCVMQGLDDLLNGRSVIGIKRMGELDEKPFQVACKKRYSADDADTKAAELCSAWQEELKQPSWQPYKIVDVDGVKKV